MFFLCALSKENMPPIALLGLSASSFCLCVMFLLGIYYFMYFKKSPVITPAPQCQPKKNGFEYSRRVQNAKKKWVCPAGWTVNGCEWKDGKILGELQCRRRKKTAGSQKQTSVATTKTPVYGDSSGGTMSEILLSGGKYAGNDSVIPTAYWVDQEGGGRATSVIEAAGKAKLVDTVYPNGEFTCNPGDWVRGVTLYSQDGWTANGVYGSCYNHQTGSEYILFDGIKKYYPTNPNDIQQKFMDGAKKDTSFAYPLNVLTGIAGRGLESRKGIQTMFAPLVNTLTGGTNAVSMGLLKIPKFQNFNYFTPTSLINADTGISGGTVYTEPAASNRIRALQFTSADGRNIGPVGTTTNMTKTSWTCPQGTVLTGMTPKIAKDTKNARNTDLVGISFTCGSPAQQASS